MLSLDFSADTLKLNHEFETHAHLYERKENSVAQADLSLAKDNLTEGERHNYEQILV